MVQSAGETGGAAIFVQSTEFGIAGDTTLNLCFYSTVCGTAGTGIGSGGAVGGTASIGTGALSSGHGSAAQIGGDSDEGAVGGASLQYDPSSDQISVARGFFGNGGGVWSGA